MIHNIGKQQTNILKKYIFLDIDGVLITFRPESWVREKLEDNYDPFDEDLIYQLNRIVESDSENIFIVISSSWRNNLGSLEKNLKWIRDVFTLRGFKYSENIISQTIRAYQYLDRSVKVHLSIPRGVEIKQWIDTNIHSNNGKNFSAKTLGTDFTYCIIDDDTDMLLEHKDNFVNTKTECGLTKEYADRVLSILNKS